MSAFLQKVDLKYAVTRYVKIDGAYRLGTHNITLDGWHRVAVDKPGIYRYVYDGLVSTANHLVTVEINPELFKVAEISGPSVLGAGEHEVSLTIRPFVKDFDPDTLDYVCRLYVGYDKLT